MSRHRGICVVDTADVGWIKSGFSGAATLLLTPTILTRNPFASPGNKGANVKSHSYYLVRLQYVYVRESDPPTSAHEAGRPVFHQSVPRTGLCCVCAKALSRLAHEGLIERVAKGIYVRPKSLASMPSIKISASAEQIAKNGHSRTATHWLDKASNPRIDLAFRHRHPSKPFLE